MATLRRCGLAGTDGCLLAEGSMSLCGWALRLPMLSLSTGCKETTLQVLKQDVELAAPPPACSHAFLDS